MVKAIDVHVHVRTGDRARREEDYYQSGKTYFKSAYSDYTADQTAEMYHSLGMQAVIFDVDSETTTGLKISNDEIAAWVRKYPEVFLGFGSVDPWKGKVALDETEHCARDLGLLGLKFHCGSQRFFPNDQRFYSLWEKCAKLGLIVLFHTGTCGMGAGSPGGGGFHLKYCRPIPYIDDVAAEFPELRIIGAHPSWPWQEEMLAVARHKSNVYIDLSGWAPKYFPPSLVHYANTLIKDRVLFGTDFPLLSPERWLKEFSELPFRDDVRPKILYENAALLLGLKP